MITAADGVTLNQAAREGDLAVGAAVFQGRHHAKLAAEQDDRVAGEADRRGFTGLNLGRPGEGIPVVRMRVDPA